MNYHKDGAKYLMYLCTLNPDREKYYMILSNDIKHIIWHFLHYKPYI